MQLSESIDECIKSIDLIVKNVIHNDDHVKLTDLNDFNAFDNKFTEIQSVLDRSSFDYAIEMPSTDDMEEEEKTKIETEVKKFNELFERRTSDFILFRAFDGITQQYLNKLIEQHKIESGESGESNENDNLITVGEFQVSSSKISIYNNVSTMLDFQIHIIINSNPELKKCFYNELSKILSTLFEISSYELLLFWNYLDSRLSIIDEKVFKKDLISDRISMLEICNPITDKFHNKDNNNKSDSYKKDSFNDRLDAKIRIFLNKLFSFEDNTGLNRYFSTASRINNEILPKKKEPFMKDIIECNKAFRDPYYYMKPSNNRQLKEISRIFLKIVDYLTKEETKYLNASPKRDPYFIKPKPTQEEEKYIKQKYTTKPYFPEHYWISVFNNNQATLDDERMDDQEFLSRLFDNSQVRQIFLVQIYIISSLFTELTLAGKRDFFKTFNLPANTKHIIDDSTNELTAKTFYKIKRELPKNFRNCDNQFSFLLQHIIGSEMFWWCWLIHGKDPNTNQPLLTKKTITDNELEENRNKFKSLFPFKEKKYFNVYVTPQLSRKMKTPTGLNAIQVKYWDLSEPPKEEENDETKSVLKWRKLRQQRNHSWLDFNHTESFTNDNDDINVDNMEIDKQQQLQQEENSDDLKVKRVKTE